MGFTTALAAMQIGTGIAKSFAQIQEAEIAAIESEYAAGAKLFNADLARQEAKLAQSKARIEVARQKKEGEKLISTQRVLYAASGVRLDVGTPLLVAMETLEEIELDLAITKFNAEIESQRLESEARQRELRVGQIRAVGKQAKAAGYIRAGTTLLETASSAAMKFGTSSVIQGGRGGVKTGMQETSFGRTQTWSPYR